MNPVGAHLVRKSAGRIDGEDALVQAFDQSRLRSLAARVFWSTAVVVPLVIALLSAVLARAILTGQGITAGLAIAALGLVIFIVLGAESFVRSATEIWEVERRVLAFQAAGEGGQTPSLLTRVIVVAYFELYFKSKNRLRERLELTRQRLGPVDLGELGGLGAQERELFASILPQLAPKQPTWRERQLLRLTEMALEHRAAVLRGLVLVIGACAVWSLLVLGGAVRLVPGGVPTWLPGHAALVTLGASIIAGLGLAIMPLRIRESVPIGIALGLITLAAIAFDLIQRVSLSALPAALLLSLCVLGGALLTRLGLNRLARDAHARNVLLQFFVNMRTELDIARNIHDRLFPKPHISDALQVAYSYEPASEIGGDFLYIRALENGRVAVVVVDVTGHGLQAALVVNRVHYELDRLFGSTPDAMPGRILADLNKYFLTTVAGDEVFATAACVVVDPHNLRMFWASAGHPDLILCNQNGKLGYLSSTTFMLGVIDEPDFQAFTMRTGLSPGDTVLLCTDGVTESKTVDGKLLGSPGLGELIAVARLNQLDGVDDLARLLRQTRAGEAADDTLLVQIRCTGQQSWPMKIGLGGGLGIAGESPLRSI